MSVLTEHVHGLVHEPTQVHDGAVDLTLAAVHRVAEPGRIDFGGDELSAPALDAVSTELRDPGDDYGWWHLDAGHYVVEHNESLSPPGGTRLTVQPRDALLARGATHPTVSVPELGPLPLSVGSAGLRLKENARVSTVVGREE